MNISNNRMYSLSRTRCGNPKQGRMLAVDNFVQSPYSSQGYNRCSYVQNSPLSYVDPTGEFLIPYLIAAYEANSWDPYGWGSGNKFDGTVVAGISSDGVGVNVYAGASLSSGSPNWIVGGNTQNGNVGGGLSSFGLPSYTRAPSAATFSIDWGEVNRANVSSQGWNNGGVDVNSVLERASRFLFNQRLHSSRTYNQFSLSASSDLIAQGPGGGSVNWYGVADASIGIVGGAAEIVIGGFSEVVTGGLSTVLIVDGVYRVATNSVRLGAYLAGENTMGNVMPSNIGGTVGRVIDGANGGQFGQVGPWQAGLGITNDLGGLVVTGGTGPAVYGFMTTQGIQRTAHGATIINNYYSVYGTANQIAGQNAD